MTIKILGITNDVTTCDKCGKTNLKRTVVLEINECVAYYGTDCAASATLGSKREKSTIYSQAHAIQLAKNWLAKGYEPKVVASGISNSIGYRTNIKNNILYIGSFGVIELN